MKIAIVVPVFNEGKRLDETVLKIKKYINCPIIVVDDGSAIPVKITGVTLLRHVINLGKGAAMRTGVEKAWNMGAEAIIFIDADGQHNPKHLPDFVKQLKMYPVVFGYRELKNNVPLVRKWGNFFASWLIGVLFGIKKKDLLSGYLGFRKEVYEDIKWSSPRYGIETEMAAKIGRKQIKFSEIKIDTIYIDKYKGVTLMDAIGISFKVPFWYFEK